MSDITPESVAVEDKGDVSFESPAVISLTAGLVFAEVTRTPNASRDFRARSSQEASPPGLLAVLIVGRHGPFLPSTTNRAYAAAAVICNAPATSWTADRPSIVADASRVLSVPQVA